MVRIALPNKGRLRAPSLRLLAQIGLPTPDDGDTGRGLTQTFADGRYQILSVNARDIPTCLEQGAADIAITGTDLVAESGIALSPAFPLGFGKARIALAVPKHSPYERAEDLPDGCRVASAFPRITQQYFDRMHREIAHVLLTGAVEAAPAIGIADAIVDLVETGTTLRSNGLRELATILPVEAAAFVRPGITGPLQVQIDELVLGFQSVSRAERSRYLMANVPRAKLAELSQLLPGVSGPTVLSLLGRDDWVAIHAVVDASAVNGIVAILKHNGATGILVTSLERMVL
ncbi:MAG: ATP phosphoribosyltransferase [Thermoplasmata archaeon]|nr:ATP phosphoribosyltransferase [Thermoplasmata archaeon]